MDSKEISIAGSEISANFSLQEAKRLARLGIKVKHEYFTEEEWMIMSGNMIIFEDGCKVFFDEWVKDKDYLLNGWSIYEEGIIPFTNPYDEYLPFLTDPQKETQEERTARTVHEYLSDNHCSLADEYTRIIKKESKLSRMCRDYIIKIFEK